MQVYIVYLGEKQHEDPEVVTSSHHGILTKTLGSKEAALGSIIYSYKHGFSGFAAKLTESQAELIAELPEVIHVIPSQNHKVQTTRSWDYLGLPPGTSGSLLSTANYGDGVIIGGIDTGIWPESPSFNDEGLGPIPATWRGTCQEGELFNSSNCNKKIVGAQYFAKGIIAQSRGLPSSTEYRSPRDANGHGTHTASTAAGSFVRNANFSGLGLGLARGGAPRSHLAIYKACWDPGACDAADMLAAFDTAIRDGVDIISVSVGINEPPQPGYLENSLSIGAFHAVARGITVVCSGGNAGPFPQKVTNGAPWVITVAASTIDRAFPTAVTLGNNRTLIGQSIYYGEEDDRFKSLVYAGDIASNRTLNSTVAEGKIVLCFTGANDPQFQYSTAVSTVYEAGGAGIIFAMHTITLQFPFSPISSVQVDYEIGTEILAYIRATRLPTAKISLTSDTIGKVVSPKVAYFSSRGPNSLSLDVLKPDVAAPGVNILAAGPGLTPFLFKSGTSMACPHVSAIAALLKSQNPRWSPAAIKSAIVTTASVTNRYGEPITAEGGPQKIADPFDFGGGHVQPNRAANPGLVYDMGVADYLQFFCSLGYSSSTITRVTAKAASCGSKGFVSDLNLPSITISNLKKTTTVARTVTNVGPVCSIYKVKVEAPSDVKVSVEPQMLNFNEKVKSLTFTVTFSPVHEIQGDFSFGSLTWMDGKHVVRIPLVTRLAYIVYLGERKHEDPEVTTSSHHDILTKIFGSKEAALGSIMYSYKHGFSGFAVRLTESQVKLIAELPEVVHVTPSETHKLHTTRSWDYLGLDPGNPNSLLSEANYGDGGSGPQSFNDEGLGAVPSTWRGTCEGGELFSTSNCNNKIVGARFFAKGIIAERGVVPPSPENNREYLSPRDANRLAIYKACWGPGACDAADVLAAFDSAIREGVDIISVSLGTDQPPQPGYLDNQNAQSIGAFHAVARGITVVCSGGNAGPFPQKVTNGAPWIMTVSASTIDRSFPTAITLGNNRTLIVSSDSGSLSSRKIFGNRYTVLNVGRGEKFRI
ncbi:Subtilisin-like protease SBT3-10 [Nymphaea thermarum]|nr:Subtilisin-like protease SBT3-10 [Nymphaea thermarum]